MALKPQGSATFYKFDGFKDRIMPEYFLIISLQILIVFLHCSFIQVVAALDIFGLHEPQIHGLCVLLTYWGW